MLLLCSVLTVSWGNLTLLVCLVLLKELRRSGGLLCNTVGSLGHWSSSWGLWLQMVSWTSSGLIWLLLFVSLISIVRRTLRVTWHSSLETRLLTCTIRLLLVVRGHSLPRHVWSVEGVSRRLSLIVLKIVTRVYVLLLLIWILRLAVERLISHHRWLSMRVIIDWRVFISKSTRSAHITRLLLLGLIDNWLHFSPCVLQPKIRVVELHDVVLQVLGFVHDRHVLEVSKKPMSFTVCIIEKLILLPETL